MSHLQAVAREILEYERGKGSGKGEVAKIVAMAIEPH